MRDVKVPMRCRDGYNPSMESVTYEPVTIGLLSELIFQPMQVETSQVQSIHNELFEKQEFSYQNFSVGPGGISMSNPPTKPGHVSAVNFMPDRLQISEEMGSSYPENYCERIAVLAELAFRKLQIPMLMAQQHIVRSVVRAKSFADSRDFLSQGVCKIEASAFQVFERPVGLFGLKLAFPPANGEDVFHNLRIESFNEDPRSIFIEDISTHTRAVTPGQLEDLTRSLMGTYNFLKDKALAFLAHFDMASR